MLAVCGSALRWGGRRERRVGVLIGGAWLATLAAQRITGEVAPVAVLAALDLVVFGLLLALSWRDRAGWMIFAVAAQGMALAVHAIRLAAPAMSTWTYLTALSIAGYALFAALAYGVWTARRERREGFSS